MKNKWSVIPFLALLTFYISPSMSSEHDCFGDTYCMVVTGIPEANATEDGKKQTKYSGRYVKIVASHAPYHKGAVCVANGMQLVLPAHKAYKHRGFNTWKIYICKYGNGGGCKFAYKDKFKVSNETGEYIASPTSSTLDLSAFADYPKCTPKNSKFYVNR